MDAAYAWNEASKLFVEASLPSIVILEKDLGVYLRLRGQREHFPAVPVYIEILEEFKKRFTRMREISFERVEQDTEKMVKLSLQMIKECADKPGFVEGAQQQIVRARDEELRIVAEINAAFAIPLQRLEELLQKAKNLRDTFYVAE